MNHSQTSRPCGTIYRVIFYRMIFVHRSIDSDGANHNHDHDHSTRNKSGKRFNDE